MEKQKKKSEQVGRYLRVAFIFLPLIAAVDTLLPSLFKSIINKQLAKVPDYKGKLESISISVLKRRITVRNLYIDKISPDTHQQTMFASVQEVAVNFDWLSLWSKALVFDVKAVSPAIFFNHRRMQQLKNAHADLDIPVTLRGVIIENGNFEYVDTTIEPATNVAIENIALEMVNIDSHQLKIATYLITAKADTCDGKLDANLTVDLGAINPTFDMNIKVENINLVRLNSFLRAYAKFDVNKGTFNLFVEAKAKAGRFNGYAKPVISNLDVLGPEDRQESFGNKLWQGVVGFLSEMLENQKHDRIATQIPFDGSFKDPKVNVAYAIIEVFVNAFVRAITPTFDYSFDKTKSNPEI